ncbi:MAG: energy transducer TonB [Gammaproteobacteria bacterium]|nr:energy transducer TonB [Gammaproteobacteria bacterium]
MVSRASSATRTSEAASADAPLRSLEAHPAADLTALTGSDDFLLELSQAVGGLASVRPVESIEAALDGVSGRRRAQVLVIDAHQPDAAAAAIKTAEAHAPNAVILVFAPAAAHARFAAALRGQPHFALLSTPIDPAQAHVLIERAVAEAATRVTAARRDALPTEQTDDAPAGAGGRRWAVGAALVVAAAIVAAGVWLLARPRAQTPTAPAISRPPQAAAPAAAPTVDLSIVQGKVDDLLEKAREAMRARRYTDPPGNNALVYYRSAAAADPQSGEARDGLQRIAGVIGGRFQTALAAGRLSDAALALANIKAAVPDDARLAGYAQQLATAEAARQRADQAKRAADANIQRLANLVDARIRTGALADGDDSAKAYAEQLQKSAPTNPATLRAMHELANAFLRAARDATLAGKPQDAQRWLTEARRAGSTPGDIAAFKHQVADARVKAEDANLERLAGLAQARLGSGSLTAPADDSAAHYLDAIGTLAPAYPGLAPARRALAEALLARARAAARAGRTDAADEAAARRFGATPEEILAIHAARGAPHQAADAGENAALMRRLKLIHNEPPDYPAGAFDRGVGGLVTVTYVVDPSGRTQQVTVVKSTPPGVFDRAAVSAVKRWRYAPVLVDGKAVSVPARILIKFDPRQ